MANEYYILDSTGKENKMPEKYKTGILTAFIWRVH